MPLLPKHLSAQVHLAAQWQSQLERLPLQLLRQLPARPHLARNARTTTGGQRRGGLIADGGVLAGQSRSIAACSLAH